MRAVVSPLRLAPRLPLRHRAAWWKHERKALGFCDLTVRQAPTAPSSCTHRQGSGSWTNETKLTGEKRGSRLVVEGRESKAFHEGHSTY